MREAPPPYAGEGQHARWHVSEDDSIGRFEPRDRKVWAIATLGGDRARRIHVIEPEWIEPMRTTRVVAYRMPEETFVEDDDRFWISTEPVEPLGVVDLGDLVERHEQAGIELVTEQQLLEFWDEVVGASLGFSGIRLRNAKVSA